MKRKRSQKARPAPKPSARLRWQSWYQSKAPLFQFCLKFCGLLAVFYALAFLPVCQRVLSATLTEHARLASAILDRMGENTKVTDATIWSGKYAITVLPACSAI